MATMGYGRGVASDAAVSCTVSDAALFTVIVPMVTPGIGPTVVLSKLSLQVTLLIRELRGVHANVPGDRIVATIEKIGSMTVEVRAA